MKENRIFDPKITKGPWTEDGDTIRDEHWNLVCWFFSHDDGYEEPEAGDLEAMLAIPELLKVYRRCRSIINRECRNIINKWGYDHAKFHFSEYLHARDAIKELEDRHGRDLRDDEKKYYTDYFEEIKDDPLLEKGSNYG